MSPKVTNFGKNLRFYRRVNGLSQTKLANELGLSRNNIASYESGMVEPNAIVFLRCAAFFSVNPESFLTDVLSELPVNPIENDEKSILSTYLINDINDFTTQTNKITKIFEGFKAYYEMQKSKDVSDQENELYHILDNVLDLLDNLVKINWDFIQSMSSVANEEE